ncbi:MAG: ankyrin repeat domain-containing protein [Bacteriovoracales bacterium]
MTFRLLIFSFFLHSTTVFSESPSFYKIAESCYQKNTAVLNSEVEYLVKNDKSFNINGLDKYGMTLLMQCVGGRKVDMVNGLLENGAFVDAKVHGQTALFTAATFGFTELVWRLLKAGANKNIKDDWGKTAADHANRSGHYEIVEILGGKPQNLFVDEKRKEAYEILSKARKNEISPEEFKRVFAPFGPLIDEPSTDGHSVLQFSAYYNRNDLLKTAISLKADVNAPNPEGTTPLMFAAMGKNLAGIQILLEAGADPNLKNNKGKTVTDFAENDANIYLTDFLRKEEGKNLKTQKEIVDYLNKHQSKLKKKILANYDKIREMNKELDAQKAPEKTPDEPKKIVPIRPTPSPAPFSRPTPQPTPQPSTVIPFPKLLEAAANSIESGNPKGLFWALDNGLPPDARLPNGNPIILATCFYGNFPALQALITRGANINIKGVDGLTPLMVAVRGYKYPLVEYLVKIGADRRIRNNFNWTAFDIARQNRDDRLMFMTRF